MFESDIISLAEADERYKILISDFALFDVMVEQDFGLQFRNVFFQCDVRAS